jgi:voltage-gated potassium channel
MIDRLQDHFIVCGFGRVGRGAAEELAHAKVPFVVIDRDEDRVERAMKAGMLAVFGDATHDDVLREVGIGKAKGLIATLASDADNLFLILSAKGLNARLHFSARIDEETSEEKMRRAGANFVFAPYKNTGHRMAQALIKPHVQQFMDFTAAGAGPDVCIEQLSISSRSSFADRTLGHMDAQRTLGLIILALRKADGSMTFNPTSEQRICAGDHLIVMGESQGLRKLEHMLTGASA